MSAFVLAQVQQKLAKLQQQRLDQLMPSSINTPAPWQHIEIKKTAVMYKVSTCAVLERSSRCYEHYRCLHQPHCLI